MSEERREKMRPQEHREEHRLPRRRYRFHSRTGETLEEAEEVFHKQRRRIWPWLLAGCAGGILTVVLVVAIVISLAVHSISGTTQSTYTQSNKQMVPISNVTQVHIANQIGDVTVTVDSSITTPIVTTIKRANVASSDAANIEFNKHIQVHVQPTGTPDTTLVVSATVPNGSDAFGDHPDSVDVMIKLPAYVQNNRSFALDITKDKHLMGNIVVVGLSGKLTLQTVVGDVIVHQANQLAKGSLLDTGTGHIIFDGSLDTTCISQTDGPPCYKMHSEVGKAEGAYRAAIDITLPITTNVFLDASTNAGKITSEFNIDIQTEGGSAMYYGPLLRNPPAPPTARLVLNVGSGDINLHKV